MRVRPQEYAAIVAGDEQRRQLGGIIRHKRCTLQFIIDHSTRALALLRCVEARAPRTVRNDMADMNA